MAEDGKRGDYQGSDPADEATQLKKRARRRLIGAVALALLAAIVLPMVMDHQPAPPMRDIQVRIPSPDEGATQRVAPKAVVAETTKAKEEPAKPIAPARNEPDVAKPEAKIEAKAEAKPEPKPETKPEQKTEIKPETKPEAKPETKPEPKPEVKVKPVEESKGGEAWEVQLGAYGEPARVKILVGKLKELGVPTYTEKVETPNGPRTRVRAGPFPSQEAAEKARQRVKIAGVDGPVAKKP